MSLRIAHVINPVKTGPESDLYVAQPITFASLKKAKLFTSKIEVELFAICYPEDREIVPEGFTLLPYLTRSVLDSGNFKLPRKLPLLCDIINGLAEHTYADYLVYSNVDIAVQPYFYETIEWIIRQGNDAFVINRRTISAEPKSVNDLNWMYCQVGEPHPGHDCFVFKSKIINQFILHDVCVGIPGVGRALIWNLIAYYENFTEFKNIHLTFHLGHDKIWQNEFYKDYFNYNQNAALRIFNSIAQNSKLTSKLNKSFPHLFPKRKKTH